MIETPTATAFKVDSADEVDAPLLDQKTAGMAPAEADLFLVKQKPITSKMRTALKHIKSVGGRGAAFRGLHVALIYHFVHSLITNLFASSGMSRPIIAIITSVVLCRIQMTWTHIVISNPSEKAWYRRFPPFKPARTSSFRLPSWPSPNKPLSTCLLPFSPRSPIQSTAKAMRAKRNSPVSSS